MSDLKSDDVYKSKKDVQDILKNNLVINQKGNSFIVNLSGHIQIDYLVDGIPTTMSLSPTYLKELIIKSFKPTYGRSFKRSEKAS